MRVKYYEDESRSNFGDDLNRWMWNRLSGDLLDDDDETLLLGIGTILSKSFVPAAKKYVVLGSGVGYDLPPDGFGGPSWDILAVRGPLTAAALGLPAEKAVIDGAALLGLLPELQPLPELEREGVAFMPHYELLPYGNWEQVCEMAGVAFLNPLADSEITVQQIRKSKLVIADAMHAAIVADALRVPWIPVVISRDHNTFKWLDWTMSLDIPYNPAVIPASTLVEALRNFSLRFWGNRLRFEERDRESAIRKYNAFRKRKSQRHEALSRRILFLLTFVIPKRIIQNRAIRGLKKIQDRSRTIHAAEKLRQIATWPASLSEEELLRMRLHRLEELLVALHRGA